LKFKNKESLDTIVQYINEISISYNIDKKKIIKDYLNYIIRNEMIVINVSFLSFVENVMHNQDCKNSHYVKYALSSIAPYH